MKNRKWMMVPAGALFLFSAISVSAFSEVSVLFQTVSGKVKVHLEEFANEGGEETSWKDGQMVLPGGILSKIPRIYNDGEPCYVRATVDFASEHASEEPLSFENLVGVGPDWVQSGTYFYYKNVLPKEGTVDFFQGIRIPETWEDGVEDGNNWSANVQVDAVQAEFFQPDFTDPDPWGLEKEGYEIQDANEEEPTMQEKELAPVRFEIEQDMKGFSVEEQEFLKKPEAFVPGKEQTGMLEFSNRTGEARTVYMRAEILETNAFLEELELVIQIREEGERKIIYEGPVLADALQEYQSLAEVPAGESEKAEFIIRLPKDADNRYAAKEGKVKFWFTTDVSSKETAVEAPKTGDPSNWWFLSGVLLPIPCLVFAAYKWRKHTAKAGRKERTKW